MLQALKKSFSNKKFFQLICVDIILKTVCGNFFKLNVSRYLNFGDFKVHEMVLHNKIINPLTKTTKISHTVL